VDRVELKINEGPPIAMVYDTGLQRYRYQPAQPWPEGISQSVLFIARDLAGNEASWGFVFTADYTPPRLVSFSPEATEDPTPLITVVLTDDLCGIQSFMLRLRLDSREVPFTLTFLGGQVTLNSQVQELLEPGVHRVEVLAQDWAGNVLDVLLPMAVR
jgi:hypothetical protein